MCSRAAGSYLTVHRPAAAGQEGVLCPGRGPRCAWQHRHTRMMALSGPRPGKRKARMSRAASWRRGVGIGAVGLAFLFACAADPHPPAVVAQAPPATAPAKPGGVLPKKYVASAKEEVFLDTLAARTFGYFWDLSDPHTGLT